ncbi:conserved hypothetical protein [Aspergillus udagawae]|uniref:Uncharacterized protein n=1 Tax=Aspergillus udagawae TaxID=91492 RepID=A0A8H3N2H6_9EURO|nr:conserved hypothetical protein [Aspergillus udagawae]
MPPEDLLLINRKYYNELHSSNFVIKYDGRPATGEGPTDGLSSDGKHSWWYMGDQEPTEASIFPSSGLRNGRVIIGTAHDQYPARQSIECRCAAIY